MKFHHPLYDTTRIRALEQAHAAESLMARAGSAIAEYVQARLPQARSSVLVLAGPGNNGGDALIAARLLQDVYQVSLVFLGDAEQLPADAAAAWRDWQRAQGEVWREIPAGQWDMVIDGLFGIGLNRAPDGKMAALIEQVNQLETRVLAIDVPSGLCANTGRVLGSVIRANWTLTFLGLKPGLFTLDGPDVTGEVALDSLGIRPNIEARGYLLEQEDVSKLLPPRQRNSNKGSFGNVGILGGARQTTGAALLSARAALLIGAGRVYVGLLDASAPGLDMVMPELMLRSGDALLRQQRLDCLAIGPGMGQEEAAQTLLAAALSGDQTLVLDADALNLLAAQPALAELCRQRAAVSVMTPHPGEAARLLACSIEEVQRDRIASALALATQYRAIVLLKGCGSVVAMPGGEWFINHSGNPGLASAGMGDVLTGIIAALIAQGLAAELAVLLAVHLHGAAADTLVQQGLGPVGLTASEIMVEARHLLNLWIGA